jgi:phosphotransferase system HPr-like phosphotransfer protein
MGLLTLEGSFGAKITITATGPDAPKAVAEIADLFEKKFFED